MSSFGLGVFAGVAGVALVTVLAFLTVAGVSRLPIVRHGLRGQVWILEHQVGEALRDDHEHAYSVWIPYRISQHLFARDAKRCVFTRVGMTAGAVWDEEVRFVTRRDFGLDSTADGTHLDEVEASIRAAYSIASSRISWTIRYESGKISPIAEAQLARARPEQRR